MLTKLARFFTRWEAFAVIACALFAAVAAGAAGHALATRDIDDAKADIAELQKDRDDVHELKRALPLLRDDVRYMRDRIDRIADRLGVKDTQDKTAKAD